MHIIQPAPVCGLVTPGGIVDEWVHPGPFEQIGTPYEIGNVAGHAAPTCGSLNNIIDATKVTSPNTLTSIAVRDVQFYLSFTPGDPMPDDAVQASGRTTGYQTGTIIDINVSYNVPANAGYCCGALTMKQQVEWLPVEPTLPGDSGSGLFSAEAPPRVVGLSWGGDGTYTYASHIDNVLSALNLTLDLTSCAADCVYARAARTLPPGGGTGIVDYLFSAAGLLGHRFRNQVLRGSAVGQQFVGYFYLFSDEAIAIAGRSPGLLLRSAQALVTIAPSVLKRIEQAK